MPARCFRDHAPLRRALVRLGVALMGLALALPLLVACGGHAARQPRPAPTATRPPTATPPYAGAVYEDAKLGFRLLVPAGWATHPQPGLRAAPENTSLTLINDQDPRRRLQLAVTEHDDMPAAFAARGTPDERIGAYPAFIGDSSRANPAGATFVRCIARIFLAGDDYVIADWCAPDAPDHAAELERTLATFQPAAATFQPHPQPASQQTCAEVLAASGYDPATAGWGRTLGTPGSTGPALGWDQLGANGIGAAICSNTRSADPYLFQCTELANRFDAEQWGLARFHSSAGRYYDYYQDGALHPGSVRQFPAGTYQLSDDASQGASAFKPRPGDLLIFQDVNDVRAGWTSGLTDSPGHVAVVTGVDDAHVYIAQENFSDTHYFMALPMQTTANGYRITDLSGIPNRIVRGWIHFTANGGPVSA